MTALTRLSFALAPVFCMLLVGALQPAGAQTAASTPDKTDIEIVPLSLSHRDTLFASAVSNQTRLAVGARGLLLIGNASGKRWQRIDTGAKDNWLAAIDHKDGGFLIAGSAGRLAGVNAQGKLEQKAPIDTKSAILSLTRFNGRLYATGEFGSLFVSADEGRSWQPEDLPWNQYLAQAWKELGESKPHLFGSCLSGDGRTLYVVGEYGLVLGLHNGVWTQVHGGKVQPAIFACATQGSALYAVGQRGTLIRSADQGKSWADQRFSDADLYAALPTSRGLLVAGDLATLAACVDKCRQVVTPDLLRWTLQLLATDAANQVLLVGSGLKSVRLP